MSLSLLKRSIAIVEEDLPDTKKKRRNKSNRHTESSTASSLHSLIPERQKLFGQYRDGRGNEVRYEKLNNEKKLSLNDLRNASALEATKAERNLEKLLRISGSKKLDPKIANSLLKKRSKRADKEVVEEKPKVEESIFTEEDFQKFEKEYFVD